MVLHLHWGVLFMMNIGPDSEDNSASLLFERARITFLEPRRPCWWSAPHLRLVCVSFANFCSLCARNQSVCSWADLRSPRICIYTYIYIQYMCIYTYIHIYMCIYIGSLSNSWCYKVLGWLFESVHALGCMWHVGHRYQNKPWTWVTRLTGTG